MPHFLFFVIVPIIAFIGGLLYRYRGGGEPNEALSFPRPVDQLLFSSIYFAIAFLTLPWWPAAILSGVTLVMVLKGHGRNMDLGTSDATHPNAKPEWYEGIIGGLYGKIPNYWYDALGLMISGLTYTAPLGLFIADPSGPYLTLGLILAASGALKAPAYMLGRAGEAFFERLLDGVDEEKIIMLDGPTSLGEFFTGFFLYLVAGTLLLILLTPYMGL